MESHFHLIIGLTGITLLINLWSIYRYNSLEYNIESDAEIMIKKIIELENKIDILCSSNCKQLSDS